MSSQTFVYKPIFPGFEWKAAITINASTPLFPVGAKYRAQVRYTPSDTIVLTTLSTEGGTLNRLTDESIEVIIPGSASQRWSLSTVCFDLVRTDVNPDQHLGIRLTVAVRGSVTAAA